MYWNDLKKSLNDKDYKIKTDNLENLTNIIEKEDPKKSVKSPIVGTAYLAPEPGAKNLLMLEKK